MKRNPMLNNSKQGRKNSRNSPWRRGPSCITKNAEDSWKKLKDEDDESSGSNGRSGKTEKRTRGGVGAESGTRTFKDEIDS